MAETINQIVGDTIGRIGTVEMTLRALIVFLYGLILGRLLFWRAFGKWSPPDIMVAIIVGSNLSRTLTGPAPLIPTLTATTVLVLAYWAVSSAARRWASLDWLVKGEALSLVRQGKVDPATMRRAALSERDLHEALRQHGVEHLDQVGSAYLERNGAISVLRKAESE